MLAASAFTATALGPISFAAASSSFWRRPVMKTLAPCAGEQFGGGEADAGAAAGDDGDFAFEFLGHDVLRWQEAAAPPDPENMIHSPFSGDGLARI